MRHRTKVFQNRTWDGAAVLTRADQGGTARDWHRVYGTGRNAISSAFRALGSAAVPYHQCRALGGGSCRGPAHLARWRGVGLPAFCYFDTPNLLQYVIGKTLVCECSRYYIGIGAPACTTIGYIRRLLDTKEEDVGVAPQRGGAVFLHGNMLTISLPTARIRACGNISGPARPQRAEPQRPAAAARRIPAIWYRPGRQSLRTWMQFQRIPMISILPQVFINICCRFFRAGS